MVRTFIKANSRKILKRLVVMLVYFNLPHLPHFPHFIAMLPRISRRNARNSPNSNGVNQTSSKSLGYIFFDRIL